MSNCLARTLRSEVTKRREWAAPARGAIAQECTLTVLVAYASAHGSTAEVAQQLADRLLKSGLGAVARPVGQIENLRPYQSVVIGSAVHNQAWLPEAAAFLHRFGGELAKRPVWLFSTYSVGETSSFFGPKVAAPVRRSRHESEAVASARGLIHVRDHRHFAGVFQRGGWSPLGDLFVRVCGGLPADHRDWRDINDWAAGIARELQTIDHVRERRRLHVSVRGRL
jgi:menaquinone-dependent protoporphyrinogen oxidase